ncbi:3-dehydroquinate synthase [soil metagenome]
MAARIPVLLSRTPYEVIVGHGILHRVGEFSRQVLKLDHCALITDSNVAPLYAERVKESLENENIKTTQIVVSAGEKSKSFGQLEEVCEQMVAGGLDRNAFVVALGGGVVGDLSGFAAAIHYRGIPHVQVPTTVVAQVDSAVGGKTGINSRGGKNLIGAFHQPSLVIADTGTLDSLPKREFNEGIAEIIKHAIIRDASMLDAMVAARHPDIAELVAQNVKIKAKIVAEDEFEKLGLRALLNYGHTVGHAIENAAGYGRFLHGEAISLGIIAATSLSVKKSGLDPEEAKKVKQALVAYDLPTTLPSDLTTDSLMAALKLDKKFHAGAIRFVLTEKIGSAFVSKIVTEAEIRQEIEALRE